MRCLFVTPHPLVPANQGPKHHTLNLLKHLARAHECGIVGLYDPQSGESWEGAERELPAPLVATFPRTRRGARVRLRQAALLSRGLPWSLAPYWSDDAARFLAALPRARYDVVCLDMFTMAQYAGACAGFPTVLLGHDAYSLAMLRAFRWGRGLGYRGRMLAKALLQISFERRTYPGLNSVACVSAQDVRWLAWTAPAARGEVVEIALPDEVLRASTASGAGPDRVVCWGNVDTEAIAAGVASFLTRAWPRVRSAVPEAQLIVWGRSPPSWLKRLMASSPGTTHVEYVDDWVSHLSGAAVAVYPQRCGAGVQTKLQAALALGVPVVASSEIARSIGLADGATGLVCATPDAFAPACVRLLTDRAARDGIAAAGRRLALTRYTRERVGGQLLHVLQQAVATRSAVPGVRPPMGVAGFGARAASCSQTSPGTAKELEP